MHRSWSVRTSVRPSCDKCRSASSAIPRHLWDNTAALVARLEIATVQGLKTRMWWREGLRPIWQIPSSKGKPYHDSALLQFEIVIPVGPNNERCTRYLPATFPHLEAVPPAVGLNSIAVEAGVGVVRSVESLDFDNASVLEYIVAAIEGHNAPLFASGSEIGQTASRSASAEHHTTPTHSGLQPSVGAPGRPGVDS